MRELLRRGSLFASVRIGRAGCAVSRRVHPFWVVQCAVRDVSARFPVACQTEWVPAHRLMRKARDLFGKRVSYAFVETAELFDTESQSGWKAALFVSCRGTSRSAGESRFPVNSGSFRDVGVYVSAFFFLAIGGPGQTTDLGVAGGCIGCIAVPPRFARTGVVH